MQIVKTPVRHKDNTKKTTFHVIRDGDPHSYTTGWISYASKLKRQFTGSDRPYDLLQQAMIDVSVGIVESESLLIMQDGEPIGGSRFGRFEGGQWFMIWIYIDEEHQRTGVFTRVYPSLEEKYGHFTIAPPYSDGMVCFLEKITGLR